MQAEQHTLYTVESQTVGRSVNFPASASWAKVDLPAAGGEGTVTSIAVTPGAAIEAGAVLYDLDLRPVVIAQGSTPSFRDLNEGTQGDDVRQLRQFLHTSGYLRDSTSDKFDAATTAAVKRWQKASGIDQDGAVRAGDIIYAPTLPARVYLAADVRVGARLDAGTQVLSTLSDAPTFEIVLAQEQSELVPTTGNVTVDDRNGGTWHAVIASAAIDAEGALRLKLTAPDGGPVCAAACDTVPIADDATLYPASIVVIPEATGPTLPAAALNTAADGSSYVVMADGTHTPVTIVASGDGRAVVEGIEPGAQVRLFGEDGETSGTQSAAADQTSASR